MADNNLQKEKQAKWREIILNIIGEKKYNNTRTKK